MKVKNLKKETANNIFHPNKRLEFILLYLYQIVIGVFTIYFQWNVLLMSLFFMFIPAVYFLIRKGGIKKNLIETVALSIPFGILIEYIGTVNKAWLSNTILPFRFMDYISIDILIWGIFYVFFTISIYTYFFDKNIKKGISKNYIKYLILTLAALSVFLFIYFFVNPVLQVPYVYLQMVIVWFVLLLFTAYKNLELFYRAIGVGLLFFPIGLYHEIISLELNHWTFEKGFHVGYIELLNRYTLPIEELI